MVVQMGDEEYRIVSSDGQEGSLVSYGEVATLKVGADYYYADVDDPDTEEAQVFRVDSVTAVKTEVVEAEFADEEEDDEEEDDEEEDDEDIVETA